MDIEKEMVGKSFKIRLHNHRYITGVVLSYKDGLQKIKTIKNEIEFIHDSEILNQTQIQDLEEKG